MTELCTKCGVEPRGPYTKSARCTSCKRAEGRAYYARTRHHSIERVRAWRDANPEKVRDYARAYTARQRYGISLPEWEELMHDASCAICGSQEHLGVDHNHDTGRVREVLCGRCNRALGLSGDSAKRLRELADYLDRHG